MSTDPLLELLRRKARFTHQELADLLSLDKDAVAKRVASWEQDGVILGYHAVIDAEAAGDDSVSAFIEDVESRGLTDKILLVCCGEMGRTPALNKDGGRDHWGNLAPLLLYGGGLRMGQVIGQSTRDGGEPASQPVTIQDLLATIMHSLLDIGQVRLMPGVPQRVIQAITQGEPIRGLV